MGEEVDFSVQSVFRGDGNDAHISSSFNSNSVANKEFQRFFERVHDCRQCPRMEGRTRVLSVGNGPLDASILFIAEAPGRLGAERTGIPLAGDQTGRNFEVLLKEANIHRESVFITNAVLCNPHSPPPLCPRRWQ